MANVCIFYVCKQVDGMDALAVKQACKFAKEHALKNGPIVSHLSSCFAIMFSKFLLEEIIHGNLIVLCSC